MGKAASLANIGSVADTPLAFRNKFINGNFDFWQRGTANGSTDSAGYLADRWKRLTTGSSLSQSRQAFTVGQTSVPGEPQYFWEGVVTSSAGSSNYALLAQYVEGVRTLAGQTAVVTFFAKADSSKNIAVEFNQAFGTGGSPSSAVFGIGVTTCALTTSWQKFTVPVTLPSISGKTLGSNGDDYLGVVFWLDAGSSFNSRTNSLGQQSGTFSIARVQIEAGPAATAFEDRPKQTELALCQRYYQISGNALGRWNSSTTCEIVVSLPVQMRSSPSISAYKQSVSMARVGIAAITTTSFSPSAAYDGGFTALGGTLSITTNNVGASAGEFCALRDQAIANSAEL